jgi:hypothetical protein
MGSGNIAKSTRKRGCRTDMIPSGICQYLSDARKHSGRRSEGNDSNVDYNVILVSDDEYADSRKLRLYELSQNKMHSGTGRSEPRNIFSTGRVNYNGESLTPGICGRITSQKYSA